MLQSDPYEEFKALCEQYQNTEDFKKFLKTIVLNTCEHIIGHITTSNSDEIKSTLKELVVTEVLINKLATEILSNKKHNEQGQLMIYGDVIERHVHNCIYIMEKVVEEKNTHVPWSLRDLSPKDDSPIAKN